MQNLYRKSRYKVIVFLVILSGNVARGEAQDNHYWAQQYGATGTLMGGAMIGGVDDNAAVYYNPGALAFITYPSLSVDANVYRMDKIRISDGAGKDMNLNSAQLSVYPQIIAGMLNLFRDSRFRFSYTMLTRNHGNVLMNARYTSQAEGPANISYVGVFDYVNQLNELWFGLGVGYQVTDKLGIGVTSIGSYRGQSYQLTNYVQEVESIDTSQIFRTETNDEAIKYSTFHQLFKFGLSYGTGRLKFGLTVTTPSILMYGKGNIQRENSVIAVSHDPSDMEDNFLIMDRKTGLKANYKHPLSIGLGVEYQTTRTRLAFSAEYFFRIGTYHLFEPDAAPFVYPPAYLDSTNYQPLIDNYLHVEYAARPVLNIGIGYSQVIYKKLTLLLGAFTDFSSYDQPAEADELLNGFGGFDIYHLSTGLTYRREKQSISLGFSYAFTPSENIPPYTVINQTPDFTGNARLSAYSYAVVMGYTYYLGKYSE